MQLRLAVNHLLVFVFQLGDKLVLLLNHRFQLADVQLVLIVFIIHHEPGQIQLQFCVKLSLLLQLLSAHLQFVLKGLGQLIWDLHLPLLLDYALQLLDLCLQLLALFCFREYQFVEINLFLDVADKLVHIVVSGFVRLLRFFVLFKVIILVLQGHFCLLLQLLWGLYNGYVTVLLLSVTIINYSFIILGPILQHICHIFLIQL